MRERGALALPRLPQPIPYQGSKRLLAPRILAFVAGQRFRRLYEPFAGSAAITVAGAYQNIADEFIISDSLYALIGIWRAILASPRELSEAYDRIWRGQLGDPATYYNTVRDEFNVDADPVKLLYVLARCVKNAPRFNRQGDFNQSPDHRRLGMNPEKMRRQIQGASVLLRKRTTALCTSFEDALVSASPQDLVYMDPPYEGTTVGTDTRYHQGVERQRLIEVLQDLHRRGVPYLLSYDGQCGGKVYGSPLPESIGAARITLNAGRSTQATLLGRTAETVESLYISRQLMEQHRLAGAMPAAHQLSLFTEVADGGQCSPGGCLSRIPR